MHQLMSVNNIDNTIGVLKLLAGSLLFDLILVTEYNGM